MKKLGKILVLIMCLSFVTATLFACNDDKHNDNDVNTAVFTLKQYHYAIYEGESRTVDIISDEELEYEFIVGDASVINIDANGVVKGVKSGCSTLTIKAGDFSEVVMIEVLKNERKILLNLTDANKVVGSTFSIVATVYDKGVNSGRMVDWDVSTECVKAINGNMLTLTPISIGYITVTATYEDLTTQCNIKVVNENSMLLETPVVTVENCKTLKWTAVPFADTYSVIINDGEWTNTNSTSFVVEEVKNLKVGEKLNIAVCAKSNSFDYIDSSFATLSLKHDYIKSAVGESFSCTVAGTVKYECSCGLYYTIENYYDNHNFIEGRCSECSKVQSEGIIYEYDAKNDVYFIAGVQDGFDSEELYSLSKYDNGKDGEKPVRYVGYKAFSMNTMIRKIVLPESVVGLAGASFYRMSNLEHLEMPGLTHTSEYPSYYPIFGEEGKTFPKQIARDNFTDTYKLKTIVVGNGFDNNCRNFFIHKWSPDDYKPILDVMVKGTNYKNLFSSPTRLGKITYSVGAKDGPNYQLTGEVYYYDETGEKCGNWWHYDEDGNVTKNKEHTIRENICVKCGYIYDKNCMFKWDETLQGYELMCVREGFNRNELVVPSVFNDGVHGEAAVVALGRGSIYSMVNLKKVILPECLKYIGETAFGGCTKLEEVVMPGVTKFYGANHFIDCIKLNKIIINNVSIPQYVTYIGAGAFTNCKGIQTVEFKCEVNNSTFATGAFTNLCIPNIVIHKDFIFQYTATIFDNTDANYGKSTICKRYDNLTVTINYAGDNNKPLANCKKVVYSSSATCDDGYWYYDENSDIIISQGHIYGEDTICDTCGGTKGLKYELNQEGTGYIVIGCDENVGTEIYINEKYWGLPVVEIGADAFHTHSGYTNNVYLKNVTYVSIPQYVTYIGAGAFTNCKGIQTVEFKCEVNNSTFEAGAFTNVCVPNIVIHKNFIFEYTTTVFDNTNTNYGKTSIFKRYDNLTVTISNAPTYNGPLADELVANRCYVYSETRPANEGKAWTWVGLTPTLWSNVTNIPTEE